MAFTYKRVCRVCGKEYKTKLPQSSLCSDECRKIRARVNGGSFNQVKEKRAWEAWKREEAERKEARRIIREKALGEMAKMKTPMVKYETDTVYALRYLDGWGRRRVMVEWRGRWTLFWR